MVEIVSFSCQTIIIEDISLAFKHNRIGVIILIKLYSYFLVIVVEDT